MSNKTPVVVSLLLGLGLFAGAGYFYSDTQKLMAVAKKAPGTVTGFERRSSKGGFSNYPVIEFATASGEIHRFTTSGVGDYAKGEVVEVLYGAGDPTNVRVNAFIELWLGSIALAAFGLLCLGVTFGTLLYERVRSETGRGKNGSVRNSG